MKSSASALPTHGGTYTRTSSYRGGSTLYRNFGKRLNARIQATVDASGGTFKPTPIEVNVLSHDLQRYAVWVGGSQLANMPHFDQSLITRAQYEECGPSIRRRLSD